MVFATALALVSAGLHATWNLILKRSPTQDRDLTSWGLFLVGGLLAVPVVVALGGPGRQAILWLALSGCVHMVYVTALVAAYRHGDLSLAYPLARGGGALTAAIGGAVLLGDRLPVPGWVALAVVAAGLISLVDRRVPATTFRDAMVTAAAIGTYTVIDAHGARLATSGLAYGLSSTATAGAGVSVLFVARGRTPDLVRALPHQWRRWVVAGVATATAYALVLVAMRHAPVGYVAMLRESSVVFGALAGWLLLGESMGRRRLMSALVILVGLVGLIVTTG